MHAIMQPSHSKSKQNPSLQIYIKTCMHVIESRDHCFLLFEGSDTLKVEGSDSS